ncbi:MAG: SPOR domain-containing protein [Stellaceae bacterium]
MSLVRADGLYRRRIFYSARHTGRRVTVIGLAVALAGAGVMLLPGGPTIPLGGLLPTAFPAGAPAPDRAYDPLQAMAAAPSEQPVPQTRQALAPAPAGRATPPAIIGGAVELVVDEPTTAPMADTIAPSAPTAATIAPSAPILAMIAPSAPPEERSAPPPMPPTAARPHPPLMFVQLSYYTDQAAADRAAAKLRRSRQHALAGLPLRVMPAESRGEPIWRVVAGPVASRERGTKICTAVQRTGRNCSVALM